MRPRHYKRKAHKYVFKLLVLVSEARAIAHYIVLEEIAR
jgi:hypothetical protein